MNETILRELNILVCKCGVLLHNNNLKRQEYCCPVCKAYISERGTMSDDKLREILDAVTIGTPWGKAALNKSEVNKLLSAINKHMVSREEYDKRHGCEHEGCENRDIIRICDTHINEDYPYIGEEKLKAELKALKEQLATIHLTHPHLA